MLQRLARPSTSTAPWTCARCLKSAQRQSQRQQPRPHPRLRRLNSTVAHAHARARARDSPPPPSPAALYGLSAGSRTDDDALR